MSITMRLEISALERKIEERDREIAELKAQLQRDPMTDLLNRQGLLERLNIKLSAQARSGGATFVAFFDIDDFKRLNTEFGHDGGDLAIITIASRLKAIMRHHDVVARWSGDEFVAAFHLSLEEIAAGMQDQILQRISDYIKKPICAKDGRDMQVSCTFGVVNYGGGETINPQALITAADEVMLNMKSRSKGETTIVAFSIPAM